MHAVRNLQPRAPGALVLAMRHDGSSVALEPEQVESTQLAQQYETQGKLLATLFRIMKM